MKIKRSLKAKNIAFPTALVYFFLSLFVMFSSGQHILRHDKGPHHAYQHATFLCAWMCAASTHIFSLQQQLSKNPGLFFEVLDFHAEQVFSNAPLFAFYIRPPPFAIS